MNKHIKIINGRKYYYASIRKGKKVTSKYLGPVDRIRKTRKNFLDEQLLDGQVQTFEETPEQEPETDESESYIG